MIWMRWESEHVQIWRDNVRKESSQNNNLEMDVLGVSQKLVDSFFPFGTTPSLVLEPNQAAPLRDSLQFHPLYLECSHLWADVASFIEPGFHQRKKCVSEDDSRDRWPHPQAWQVSGHPCLGCLPEHMHDAAWTQASEGVALFTHISLCVRWEMEREQKGTQRPFWFLKRKQTLESCSKRTDPSTLLFMEEAGGKEVWMFVLCFGGFGKLKENSASVIHLIAKHSVILTQPL